MVERVLNQPTIGKRLISPKLRRIGQPEGYTFGGIGHWCPGCLVMHAFAIDGPNLYGERWSWNGVIEAPTFTPDMNLAWGDVANKKFRGFGGGRCHSKLVNGVISFFGDCTHALNSGSVLLPNLPGHLRD
jgi:hypothetical protein